MTRPGGPPPSGPFLLPSVEVRWFFQGELPPALDRWIEERADPAASGSRTDRYIRIPGAPHTGIKLREGRIEVKARLGSTPPSAAIPGSVERWVKWSQPIPGDPPRMEGPGVEIVEVAKTRRAWFDDGLLREVTGVRCEGWGGWTVGLEGPDPLPLPGTMEQVVTDILGLPGVASVLTPERSASYPEWIESLVAG